MGLPTESSLNPYASGYSKWYYTTCMRYNVWHNHVATFFFFLCFVSGITGNYNLYLTQAVAEPKPPMHTFTHTMPPSLNRSVCFQSRVTSPLQPDYTSNEAHLPVEGL